VPEGMIIGGCADPDHQALMLSMLRLLADGEDHALRILANEVAIEFKLTG